MLKTSKKILSIIMVVIMVLTAVPLSSFMGIELPAFDLGIRASALAESGQCGDNVYWNYDSATGELVISGTGPMWDYEFTYTNYWQEYVNSPFYKNNSIKTVFINDGVASIGNYAFYNCDGIIDVTIADSVVSAGEATFHYCDGITYIDIGNGITALDAFFTMMVKDTLNLKTLKLLK